MPEIDKLYRRVIELGGSDLHLSSNTRPMVRVHGRIGPLDDWPVVRTADIERMLREIMRADYLEEYLHTSDTDLAYELDGGVARFRVNVFKDRHGWGSVSRLIPSKIMTVEDLNLSKAILDLCMLNKGLVLVTGPTGSGKSTTLCAMVDYINRHRHEHILTIEDPIEFVHENKNCLINQREVRTHTKSFPRALRAALREDPNIVLIGELRDLETTMIALETAETGHLVFGTLHTSTAHTTVDRLIDQFPAGQQDQVRTMLAESLKAVIAQTLCRKKGGKGRIAALEVLIVNIPAAANIREGKTHQLPLAMQTGKKLGMVQLNDALMELINAGLIEPEEAYMKSVDKATLVKEFERSGIQFKSDEVRAEREERARQEAIVKASSTPIERPSRLADRPPSSKLNYGRPGEGGR